MVNCARYVLRFKQRLCLGSTSGTDLSGTNLSSQMWVSRT